MKTTAVLLALLLLASSRIVLTQEKSGEIITISERVGEAIDSSERARFNLFPAVKGFRSAVFVRLPDSTFALRITSFDSAGMAAEVSDIPQPEWRLRQWAEKIDHYEEIEEGKYGTTVKVPVVKRPWEIKLVDLNGWGDSPKQSFCFRGRPLQECRTFLITETGYYLRPGAGLFERGNYPSWEVGAMVNVASRHAVGVTYQLGTANAAGRTGIKGRYRYWLTPSVSAEIASGPLFGNSRNGWTADAAINVNDRVAMVARVDHLKSTAFHFGFRFGSDAAVAANVVALAVGVIWVATHPIDIGLGDWE